MCISSHFFSLEQRWSNKTKGNKTNQPLPLPIGIGHCEPTADVPIQAKSISASTVLDQSPLLCYNPQHKQKPCCCLSECRTTLH